VWKLLEVDKTQKTSLLHLASTMSFLTGSLKPGGGSEAPQVKNT